VGELLAGTGAVDDCMMGKFDWWIAHSKFERRHKCTDATFHAHYSLLPSMK
jgi:hypothetical protein